MVYFNLNHISGLFIFLGLCCNKIDLLSLPNLFLPYSLTTTLCYLLGYACWFMATYYYPPYQIKSSTWLGFSHYRHQIQLAAAIGAFAVIVLSCSTAFLGFFVGLGALMISNFLWLIAEQHKLQYLVNHTALAKVYRQRWYVNYVACMAFYSVLRLISTVIAFFLPMFIAATVYILVILFGIALALTTFNHLFNASLLKKPLNIII